MAVERARRWRAGRAHDGAGRAPRADGSARRTATAVTVLLAGFVAGCGGTIDLGGDEARRDALGAGRVATCAVRGASLSCWGLDVLGLLGPGRNDRRTCPDGPCLDGALMTIPVEARAVAVGGATACALDAGGNVWCWGGNASGELGLGLADPDAHPIPQEVALPGPARSVSLGRHHACAVTSAGVWCWGLGAGGRLGVADAALGSCPASAEVAGELGVAPGAAVPCAAAPIALPDSDGAVGVATGAATTCVVLTGGAALCTGDNGAGQAAHGGGSTAALTPTALPPVTALALGEQHGCAVALDGGVHCWGRHAHGELGVGGAALPPGPACTDCTATPLPVLALVDGAVDVRVGARHSCALTADGQAWCWGDDTRGALGNSVGAVETCTVGGVDTPCARRPVRVGPLEPVVRLAAGEDHACAQAAGGTVWCWGENENAQAAGGPANLMLAFPGEVYGWH